jgi:rhodanese-related sulfurtransferase/rubrerythrin
MGVMDYFKPVSSWTAQKVREFLDSAGSGEYNLVDVRQPGEYEQGHLPGARLIPVGHLPDRLKELEPGKTTIVYCKAGVRSRAAASILEHAGFRDVHSMAGGMNAWQGLVAGGCPEAGISWFAEAHTRGELTALAWLLEDGTGLFYRKMSRTLTDPDAAALFEELAGAEDRHKELLSTLYRELTGAVGEVDFPSVLGSFTGEKTMEGGMALNEALAWSEGKSPRELLELSISLESGSYDRYLAMQERVTDDYALRLFKTLAVEEKRHLDTITAEYDKLI